MRIIIAVLTALSLAACAAPAPTPQAQQSVEQYLGGNVTYIVNERGAKLLVIHDEIVDRTDDVALPYIRSGNVDWVVLMDNRGGLAVTSQRIGYAIRANKVSTGAIGGCYSACVDIFISGWNREVYPDTEFGIHAPDQILASGIAADREYYNIMGQPQMLRATYSIANEDMYFFSAAEAISYGIATGYNR